SRQRFSAASCPDHLHARPNADRGSIPAALRLCRARRTTGSHFAGLAKMFSWYGFWRVIRYYPPSEFYLSVRKSATSFLSNFLLKSDSHGKDSAISCNLPVRQAPLALKLPLTRETSGPARQRPVRRTRW